MSRIEKEFAQLQKSRTAGFLNCTKLSTLQWSVNMKMPDNTPYQDGILELLFIFPPDYPQQPPDVIPQTPILHINLKQGSNVCISILQDEWSSFLNVSKILLTIESILQEPETQTPVDTALLQFYEQDRDQFEKQARIETSRMADEMPQLVVDLPERSHLEEGLLVPPGTINPVQSIMISKNEEGRDALQHLQEQEKSRYNQQLMSQYEQQLDKVKEKCKKLSEQLSQYTYEPMRRQLEQQLSDMIQLRKLIWAKFYGAYKTLLSYNLMIQ